MLITTYKIDLAKILQIFRENLCSNSIAEDNALKVAAVCLFADSSQKSSRLGTLEAMY